MQYQVFKNQHCKQRWKDLNKKSWPYISAKDAENLEIDMNKVIADIGTKSENNGDILEFLGRELLLKKYEVKKRRLVKTLGYIPCKDENGNDYYVRIQIRNNKIYVLPLILVFILLIVGGTWWTLNKNSKFDFDESAISYQMPNGTKNENPNEIMIPIFSEFVLEKGSDKVNGGLFNPEGNPCFFEFRIYLKESSETIYQSKLVKPGTGIREFKLNQKLKSGEYEIGVSVLTSSLNDPKIRMNGGDIPAKLVVK